MSYKKLIREDCNKFYDPRNIKNYYKGQNSELVKRISCSQNLNYSVCTLSLLGNLNVGTIMRTAQMFGVDKYFVFGRRIFDCRSRHSCLPRGSGGPCGRCSVRRPSSGGWQEALLSYTSCSAWSTHYSVV